ncbi:recombinase family protein [Flectobacillus major]|jgi:DNA invertase Pin-like site-specific DNA recombinase|uniref:recombinase family protein n=1 Tax=Flectobacillus major TaxID=103 RepID=UPI0003FFD02F|nr:recombinase family protein [Flectobacillus major]
MKIGYARVSTQEQTLDLQVDALKKYGCESIYTDKISGLKAHKPEFEEMMKFLREGDTIVIWKLDRLGRSTKHLIDLVAELEKRKINLVSLNDPIDTTSPSGILVFQIFCALAEHERNIIVQRTKAGLASARARGRMGGRPKGLLPAYQAIAPAVKELYDSEKQSTTQIMKFFKIGSRRTFYKILAFAGVQVQGFTKKRGRRKEA